ncbi:MAG: hypothetical protein A2X94_13260 [Bdellovibrionales bacterium GWB1_55_8]|nr:MAG: hypothetical protein A2X94_13260 [Bdellovibrionales bacterium GWB1_55_8]
MKPALAPRTLKTSRNMQIPEFENGPFRRREPGERVSFHRPGENASPICIKQGFGLQVPAYAYDAIRIFRDLSE